VFAIRTFAAATATATTATTTVSTASSPAATGVRSRLILARTRFIAGNLSAGQLLLIQPFDGCESLIVIRHFNKRESAGATCFPIHDDADSSNLTELTKRLLDFVLCCSERQIANVNIRH
jgi:hypothetical protein